MSMTRTQQHRTDVRCYDLKLKKGDISRSYKLQQIHLNKLILYEYCITSIFDIFYDDFIKFKHDVNDTLNSLKINCQISTEALENERKSKMKMKKKDTEAATGGVL